VRFVAVAVNIEIGEPPSSVLADHDTVVCCVSLLVLVTPLGSPGTVGASTAPAGGGHHTGEEERGEERGAHPSQHRSS